MDQTPKPLFPTDIKIDPSLWQNVERPPTRVFRMPRPVPPPAVTWLILFAVIPCIVLVISVWHVVGNGYRWMWFIPTVFVLSMIPWERRRLRRKQVLREQWMSRHAAELADPVAREVTRLWQDSWLNSSLGASVERSKEAQAAARESALVFVAGDIDVPQVGDMRFEPEILSSSRKAVILLKSPWFWIQTLTLVYISWGPGGTFRSIGTAYNVLFALLMYGLVTWILISAIFRPRYQRFAPGIVQFIKFPCFDTRPEIRSYPMIPGTIAIVLRAYRGGGIVVQMKRGRASDFLVIEKSGNTQTAMERMWQALLSTAPTPPLSEEDLVG